MMNKIIKISLIVSIIGLLSGCGVSKQEKIAQKKAQKERYLKYKKIRADRIKAKKLEKTKTENIKKKKQRKKKEKQSATIEALGYGNTKDEALKNAFSTAVSEYVGVLVDAKEVTKNGKLIEDKILTFSNGYIDSYKTISSKEQMGLWEVKIIAVIKQQQILSQIKKLKIKAIDIKDSKNRYAKIISQIKTKFEAEDFLVKLMKDIASKETFYRYINIRIENIKIVTDEATRKYVPIIINFTEVINVREYNNILNDLEKNFIKLGAKRIHLTSENNSIKLIKEMPNVITTIKIGKSNLVRNDWEFPNSYRVIYPFQNGFDEYNIDEKRINLNITEKVHRYNISLLNDNQKSLLEFQHDPQSKHWLFKTSNGMSVLRRYYGGYMSKKVLSSAFYIGSYNSSNISSKYDFNGKFMPWNKTRSLKFKVPLTVIKNLKKIKIKWVDK